MTMTSSAPEKAFSIELVEEKLLPVQICVHSIYGNGGIAFKIPRPCGKDVISTCERVINRISCGRDNSSNVQIWCI